MIDISRQIYEYFEEINSGILDQFLDKKDKISNMVLDVGCGTGILGEAIKSKGYYVWGIESNTDAANTAKLRLDRIIVDDLQNIPLITSQIDNLLFDHLIFSDVLEHLYDPYSILCEYSNFLKEGGYLYISVPNVVVWDNRLKFIFGHFDYQPTGVMDRTHIRFFTYKSAKELVEATGFKITKIDYTPMMIQAFLPIIKKYYNNINHKSIMNSHGYHFYQKYIYPVEYVLGFSLKGLFAFRIIIVGKKTDERYSNGSRTNTNKHSNDNKE